MEAERAGKPHRAGEILPPEWAEQDWLWIGLPHDEAEWPGMLAAAQAEIASFANAVADTGQAVRLLVNGEVSEAAARRLTSAAVTLERAHFGDIWLRDTGPLIRSDGKAAVFAFNGWGGKYQMPGDAEIGAHLAEGAEREILRSSMVFEGGAIDGDGSGAYLTTRQCLLNPNRNPAMDQSAIERELAATIGASRMIWLGDGLVGDHTDGHVDNLARFVAPGHVVCPEVSAPAQGDAIDPNAAIYEAASQALAAAGLRVSRVPSPGRIERGGEVQPASYMNFVIANRAVIVPQFGTRSDEAAIEALSDLFPGREVIGLPASAVLTGGGSFHCASQQMPRLNS